MKLKLKKEGLFVIVIDCTGRLNQYPYTAEKYIWKDINRSEYKNAIWKEAYDDGKMEELLKEAQELKWEVKIVYLLV